MMTWTNDVTFTQMQIHIWTHDAAHIFLGGGSHFANKNMNFTWEIRKEPQKFQDQVNW